MNKIILLFFIFLLKGVDSFSQMCVQVNCKRILQLPLDSVALNGKVTTTDSIKTIQWTQLTGTQTIIKNAKDSNTIVTNIKTPNTYIFALTAVTNKNISSIKYDTIVVLQANIPPIAIIKANTNNITLPVNSVILDGSSSIDSDGSIVNYKWWPTGDTTKAISPIFGAAGTYNFSLTVTDNSGANSIANTSIIVNPQLILPPTCTITGTLNVTGTSDTLVVNAIDPNPGGSIKQYGWGKLAGPGSQTVIGANTSKAIITGLQNGTYTYKVTVWNAAGLTTGASITFVVNQLTKTISKIIVYYSDGSTQQIFP